MVRLWGVRLPRLSRTGAEPPWRFLGREHAIRSVRLRGRRTPHRWWYLVDHEHRQPRRGRATARRRPARPAAPDQSPPRAAPRPDRAPARAAGMPPRSTSPTESSTRRHIVSEATGPNTSRWWASVAMSPMHSPPSASITAISTSTRPGSCAICGVIRDANTADNRAVILVRSARSASSRVPTCDAAPAP